MLDFQYQQANSNSFAKKISDCGVARESQRRLYMLYIACMLTCSYLLSSFFNFKCLLFYYFFTFFSSYLRFCHFICKLCATWTLNLACRRTTTKEKTICLIYLRLVVIFIGIHTHIYTWKYR